MPGARELGAACAVQCPASFPTAGSEALWAEPGQGSGDGMSWG